MVPNTEIAIADQAGNFKSPITMRGIGSAITAILGYRKENCPYYACKMFSLRSYRLQRQDRAKRFKNRHGFVVERKYSILCAMLHTG